MTDDRRQTEIRLARRMFAGDADAARQLVETYRVPLLVTLLKLVGDRAEAEDLFQETFLRAIRAQAKYDVSQSFRAWLFRVAINLTRDRIRRKKLPQSPTVTADGRLPEPRGGAATMLEAARENDRKEMMRVAINALPPAFKEVVVLRYYEGFTQNEISQVLGIPPGTVKSRLFHGIQKMRKSLEGMEP